MSPEGNGLEAEAGSQCRMIARFYLCTLNLNTYEEAGELDYWPPECSRVVTVEGFRARL
jgi:hypothetical protein